MGAGKTLLGPSTAGLGPDGWLAGSGHMPPVSISPWGRDRREPRIICNILALKTGELVVVPSIRMRKYRSEAAKSDDILGTGQPGGLSGQHLPSPSSSIGRPLPAGLQRETQLVPPLGFRGGTDPNLTSERTSFPYHPDWFSDGHVTHASPPRGFVGSSPLFLWDYKLLCERRMAVLAAVRSQPQHEANKGRKPSHKREVDTPDNTVWAPGSSCA